MTRFGGQSPNSTKPMSYTNWFPSHPGQYTSLGLTVFKGPPIKMIWRGILEGTLRQKPAYAYPYICETQRQGLSYCRCYYYFHYHYDYISVSSGKHRWYIERVQRILINSCSQLIEIPDNRRRSSDTKGTACRLQCRYHNIFHHSYKRKEQRICRLCSDPEMLDTELMTDVLVNLPSVFVLIISPGQCWPPRCRFVLRQQDG